MALSTWWIRLTVNNEVGTTDTLSGPPCWDWHRIVNFIACLMLAHHVASWHRSIVDRGTMGRYDTRSILVVEGKEGKEGSAGGGEEGEGGGSRTGWILTNERRAIRYISTRTGRAYAIS